MKIKGSAPACLLIAILLCAGLLPGCGSGGSVTPTTPPQTGSLALTVIWPSTRSRQAPENAASMVVRLFDNGAPAGQAIITRPQSTYLFSSLPADVFRMEVDARSYANGAGTILASGAIDGVGVGVGLTSPAPPIILSAPVATVTITPNPGSVALRGSVILTATAKDLSRNLVLEPPGAVRWSSADTSIFKTSGGSSSVTATLTGISLGATTITAVDTLSGQSGSVPSFVSGPRAQGTMIDLGVLPGESESIAAGINNAGQVVGACFSPTQNTGRAFIWDAVHGMRDLAALRGVAIGGVNGINATGDVIGNSVGVGVDQAMVWTSSGGIRRLVGPPGYLGSNGFAINAAGQAVGNVEIGTGFIGIRAALWDPTGGFTNLGTLPGDSWSDAEAINSAGQVVGLSNRVNSNSNQIFAFIWDAVHGMQPIGTLPGGSSALAFGINDHSQVVGNVSGQTIDRGYIWDSVSGMRDLGTLPGDTVSSGSAINNHGQVAGVSKIPTRNSLGESHAFIWDPAHWMQPLGALPGDSFSYATGINDYGQVVGASYTSANGRHAFLFTPAGFTPPRAAR
jgi:probable HAF family extracellular repeat protein